MKTAWGKEGASSQKKSYRIIK